MTALICLPTRYIAGRMMLVRGLVLGLTMVLVEPSANPLADLPDGLRIDFSAMIPLQLQTILDHSAQNPSQEAIGQLNQLHALLLGGGPVSASLEALLQELQAPVYHTYGMTESATHIALRRLNGRQKSAAFVPLPGVQLTVDERGCLNICSAVTNGQVLQTNDIVDLRPDGSFVWLGRWDNVINSGGVKVQVEKVERAVEQGNLGKRRFFVGALPDRRLGETVTLFIEGAALDDEQEQNLLAHLRTQLDKYELPRRIVYLPGFVETPTGKIDRRRTAEHYG
jgi:O-succinylbenzoic acid--CoA ligase